MKALLILGHPEDEGTLTKILKSQSWDCDAEAPGFRADELSDDVDLVFIKAAMVFGGAAKLLPEIRQQRPHLSIVVVDGNRHPLRTPEAFEEQARAWQHEGALSLLEAPLSAPRVIEVLQLLQSGKTLKEMQASARSRLRELLEALARRERQGRPFEKKFTQHFCTSQPASFLKKIWLKTQIAKPFPYDLADWVLSEDDPLWALNPRGACPVIVRIEGQCIEVETRWKLAKDPSAQEAQELLERTQEGLIESTLGCLDFPKAYERGLEFFPKA